MTSKPKANRAPTPDEQEKTAAIVTVGNELLSGLVENCNASWLARELLDCGILLKLILTLPDDVPTISKAGIFSSNKPIILGFIPTYLTGFPNCTIAKPIFSKDSRTS